MLDNAREYSQTPDAARMRKWRSNGRIYSHPDLILGFIVQKQCSLCGDGISQNKRECQLHPEICDACEKEYCECKVQESVDLMSLEDIANLSDSEKIPLLKARKITLRAAGKSTNSMPNIQVKAATEFVYLNFKRHPKHIDDDDETNPSTDNIEKVLEENDPDVDR